MIKKKQPVSINLDGRLKERLDKIAIENSLSRSKVVEDILLEFFLKEKPKFW